MRLAVISDIHANVVALEAVLEDIADRGVDAIVNLGDCVSGPLWPKETMELLESRAIPTVRGNHDRWITDRPRDKLGASDRFVLDTLDADWVRKLYDLPKTIELSADVLAVHGTPWDDNTYLLEDTSSGRMAPSARDKVIERLGDSLHWPVILCGHSHRQAVVQIPGGPLILTGILTGKLPLVQDALDREGFTDVQVRTDGEWALVTARAGE